MLNEHNPRYILWQIQLSNPRSSGAWEAQQPGFKQVVTPTARLRNPRTIIKS
jgi:hypothetical protein